MLVTIHSVAIAILITIILVMVFLPAIKAAIKRIEAAADRIIARIESFEKKEVGTVDTEARRLLADAKADTARVEQEFRAAKVDFEARLQKLEQAAKA